MANQWIASRRSPTLRWALPLLLLTGCSIFSPVRIARDFGSVGWFQADEAMRWQPVDGDASCDSIASRVREGTVIIFVHGVKGDGEEISSVLPTVAAARPSAVFLYRWVAWDERDAIARNFAAGISHLLDCVPWIDGRIVVVAHSAGGIVVGYGATRLTVPRRERKGPALYVITVAAPLAGVNGGDPRADGHAEAKFILDFASRINEYPVAPLSMAAVHLRTQYPSDQLMKPTALHVPNDPRIGIPGARQIDLPASLDHNSSMQYVAERIADGTWRAWFGEPGPVRAELPRPPRSGLQVDEHHSQQRGLFRQAHPN